MKKTGLTREQLAEIATSSLLNGQSQKQIADSMTPKTNQTAIARALKEAWELGVISYSIDPDFAIRGVRNQMLEDRLRSAFRLRGALVLNFEKATDDEIHVALANAAGEQAIELIENGDHIAVAGGRTVIRLAQVLTRRPRLFRDITVSPLGGRLWFGRLWSERGADDKKDSQLERPLNADYSASILALGLIGGRRNTNIRFSQISQPLYAESQKDAHEIMRVHCAFLPGGKWNWALRPPQKAFVGVGVVDPQSGHQMAQFLEAAGDNSRIPGRSAFKQIDKAIDFVKQRDLPFFGDIGNRLFPALPLPDKIQGRNLDQLDAAYGQLISKLETVNIRAAVVEWSHLLGIDSIRVVAGGKHKRNVLWTLLLANALHPELRLIANLSTDADTCSGLLSAKAQFDSAPEVVRTWFVKMVDVFVNVWATRDESDSPRIRSSVGSGSDPKTALAAPVGDDAATTSSRRSRPSVRESSKKVELPVGVNPAVSTRRARKSKSKGDE